MQKIKNIIVGFLVSFVGSIPLGYLNIIGYEIYIKKGLSATFQYLIGVIIIEGFVIYAALIFTSFLTQNSNWIKRIEIFTIIFLLILGLSFFINDTYSNKNDSSVYTGYSSFLTGVILNCLNFIQIPFWTGWNLYLINNQYITTKSSEKFFYIIGTLLGTFFGMLGLILGLHYFSKNNSYLNEGLILKIIPLIFFFLALIQIIKFYKKYYNTIKK